MVSHYDGFAPGIAGKLDSMLIPAFSLLIKQGTACSAEGDIKITMNYDHEHSQYHLRHGTAV